MEEVDVQAVVGTSRSEYRNETFHEVYNEEQESHHTSQVETTVVEVRSSRSEATRGSIFTIEAVKEETVPINPWGLPSKIARMTQDQMKSEHQLLLDVEEEPKDRYYLVYLIFVLNGAAIWMCWLLLNFLSPSFYFDYWYSTRNMHIPLPHAQQFMDSLGAAACTPLFVLSWLCVLPFVGDLLRIFGCLGVNILALLTFMITATWVPVNNTDLHSGLGKDSRDHMYSVTFPTMLIMMACTGAFQSCVYSMAADLPRHYSNATTIGNYIGGMICSFLYVFTTTANHKDPRPTAATYYGFTFGYLTLCTFALCFMYSTPFYSYYKKKADVYEMEKPDGSLGARTKRYFSELGGVFKQAWPELANIFILNFAFWTIWPAFNIGVEPWPTPGIAKLTKNEPYFMSIGTFLNFYTMSVIGSVGAACFVSVRFFTRSFRARLLLFIPCILVWLFIPYFMYCNFIPNYPKKRVAKTLFKSIWYYYIGNGLFGLIIGFLATILMTIVSRVVVPNLSRMAARLAAALLITGLYFGAGMSPVYIGTID